MVIMGAEDFLEDNIDLNHVNYDTALAMTHNFPEEFLHFPIYTKHPNDLRLKNIELQMKQEGRKEPTWEENREIDSEFGTTYITICLN